MANVKVIIGRARLFSPLGYLKSVIALKNWSSLQNKNTLHMEYDMGIPALCFRK